MPAIESWNVSTVLAVALMLVAAAMLIVGLSMTRRLRGQDRSRQVVDQALAKRGGRAKAPAEA
ncbi:MAG: type II secretion system F family protein, partial [Achromobacter pulmonis]